MKTAHAVVTVFVFFTAISAGAGGPESVLQTACQSKAPVLVMDSFQGGNAPVQLLVDLNGDDTPDIAHGQFVEKIVQLGGHATERLNIAGDVVLEDIEGKLSQLVEGLEKGELHYSRINFSQEMPLKLAAFKKDLFADDASVPDITAQNIGEYKEKILQKLWTDRPDFRLQEMHGLFQRLEKLGVPFVIAAGNNGPGYVNLFSLFPGVISVGALNLDGGKRPVSADNILVEVWKRGCVVNQEVNGGIDIDNDGAADFPSTGLSKDTRIVTLFAGEPVTTAVSTVEQELKDWAKKLAEFEGTVPNAILNVLPAGLYRVADLVQLPTVTPGTSKHFQTSGTFVFKSKESHPPTFFFEQDDQGRIVFDPLKTGQTNQLNMVSGTSFAAPAVCSGAKFL